MSRYRRVVVSHPTPHVRMERVEPEGSRAFVPSMRNGVIWAMGGVAVVALAARAWKGERDFGELAEGVVVGMLLTSLVDVVKTTGDKS